MIAGFLPCSFIDYPGILSAVVFLHGCNLRCPYCHNVSLVEGPAPRKIDEGDVLSFLVSRIGRIGGVVVSGGEPTLYPMLRPFIDAVRVLGFKVKLDTNGTRPGVLDALLNRGLLDYVAMDLKDEPEAYGEFCGMRDQPEKLHRSIRLILDSRVDHEFRTTVVLPRHDTERLGRMAGTIAGARLWILQGYRPGGTLVPDPPFHAPDAERLEAMAAQMRAAHGINCACRWELPSSLVQHRLPALSEELQRKHRRGECGHDRVKRSRICS
jgi:pyruvate formate lyase activating enzyme